MNMWNHSSDGGNKIEVYREFIKFNGQPFIKAIIKLTIQNFGEINFDINEQYAYGEASKLQEYRKSFAIKRLKFSHFTF